jgi:ABC-type transport system involved in multi-copper enzyme maturation permease subunit
MSRTINGKELYVTSPSPKQYKGDMSDFPYFNEAHWAITDSLRTSLSNLFILFLWNVVLFVTAHYIFARRSLK